jgi:nucleotide-binding universal stress UspA family protein
MTTRVLVPYDGSDQATYAVEYAVESFPDATLELLYVIDPYTGMEAVEYGGTNYQREQTRGETLLETAIEEHDIADRAEQTVMFGRPVRQILGYATENPINHICMGSHGRDGAARLLLGSVAETVVRRAPVPTSVVRQPIKDARPESILVPFDGSAPSRRALEHALTTYPDATITALYVLYPSEKAKPAGSGEAAEIENWVEQRDDQAASVLDTAEEVAVDVDGSIETASIDGKPASAIVEYIDDENIGHVVMGSTGRDGLTRLLLGSVAETVVRRSPVSVTVVT